MQSGKLDVIVVAGIFGIGGACSLAGLDDYASGAGGQGGKGGGATGTGGHGEAGAMASGGTSTGTGSGTSGGTGTGGSTGCAGVMCGDGCVDTATDPSNCGACGVVCANGYGCDGGVCGNVPVDVSTLLVTCAALRNGEVWCWGRDVWGEAGIPSATADTTCPLNNNNKCQSVPVKIDGVSAAVEVATGVEATCARTSAGEVYCWGSNAKGLLGHDPSTDIVCNKAGGPNNGVNGRCSPSPKKVALPDGVAAAKLVMGGVTACVLTTTKDVYCWGSNENGEVMSPVGGVMWQPTKNANVNGDAEDLAVSVDVDGKFSTVCVRQAGTDAVRCWGQSVNRTIFETVNSASCQTAYCSPTAKMVYQVFGQPANPVLADRVQVGWLTGCALRQGAVTCWGDDNYGQSGLGPSSPGPNHFDPTPVAGISGAAAISNRFLTTLVLDGAGSVWGLGWNDEGQLGDGTFSVAGTCPLGNGQRCQTTAKALPALSNVAKVVSGTNNGAAITKDGKLLMWGSNYTAALGHAPGASGDVACPGSATLPCNPVPAAVTGLP